MDMLISTYNVMGLPCQMSVVEVMLRKVYFTVSSGVATEHHGAMVHGKTKL
ncbi:predicted protein [Botrytis cinerea T4]|uniref:Uncharacterized protein n=1 Tax=Botryotinia fuckeliana (strain T4) TaxID=999810 RepID=G2YHK4_BOTF4|nr:predicted protein [Botrytis cinerea T4]